MKKILITGGTSGLGLAAAISFLEKGHEVYISGRNTKKGQEVLETIPSQYCERVHFIEHNQGEKSSNEKLISYFKDLQLDVAIFNAGVQFPKEKVGNSVCSETIRINYWGVRQLAVAFHELYPNLREVLVTSMAREKPPHLDFSSFLFHNPLRPRLEYKVSKEMIYLLYFEFLKQGYNLSLLHPGVIKTNIYSSEAPTIYRLFNNLVTKFTPIKEQIGDLYYMAALSEPGYYALDGFLEMRGKPCRKPLKYPKKRELDAYLEAVDKEIPCF